MNQGWARKTVEAVVLLVGLPVAVLIVLAVVGVLPTQAEGPKWKSCSECSAPTTTSMPSSTSPTTATTPPTSTPATLPIGTTAPVPATAPVTAPPSSPHASPQPSAPPATQPDPVTTTTTPAVATPGPQPPSAGVTAPSTSCVATGTAPTGQSYTYGGNCTQAAQTAAGGPVTQQTNPVTSSGTPTNPTSAAATAAMPNYCLVTNHAPGTTELPFTIPCATAYAEYTGLASFTITPQPGS